MIIYRTIHARPDPGEDLDVASVLAATLAALGVAPGRRGDAVPVRAAHRPREAVAAVPAAAATVASKPASQATTVVDLREELAADRAARRVREERTTRP